MKILFPALLVLAGLLFLIQVANLASMHASDPMGRYMSKTFGIFLTIGLWVLLAGTLAVARTKGPFPSFSSWAVLILLPASLAAMLATNSLFGSTLSPRWLILPVAVPPLLLALFAVALWVPALRPGVESFSVNCVVWGLVLLLSAPPWFYLVKQPRANASDARKLEGQEEKLTQRERFARLSSTSPLGEWLEFAEPGAELRQEALAGIRQLPRRQAEAEVLLANGEGLILELLPDLDLEATPALSQHARKFLLDFVQSFPELRENPNSLPLSAHRLERYTPALAWLRRHGGDVVEVLDSIEAFARRHPDSPQRTELLGEVEKLRWLGR